MTLPFKTGIVISLLSLFAIYLLRITAKKSLRAIMSTPGYITVLSFTSLCISNVFIALAALSAVVAYFTRKRLIAAGVAFFVIITMPNIPTIVMAGSIQLIVISIEISVILGLLVGSMMWKGRSAKSNIANDLPAYMIIAIITIIDARDTTVTNILRVVVHNVVFYILPYLLIRNSLREANGIRSAFLFITAAGLCLSAVAIFESVRVWPMYQTYGHQFSTMMNAGVKMRGGMLRAAGPMMNPPLSGAVLALCFVTAFASRDLFKTQVGHRVVLIVLIIGLFSMQARGAWLGAACGAAGVIVSRRGASGIMGYGFFLVLGAGAIYGLTLVNPRFADLVGFSADAKGSNQYRDQFRDLAFEIIKGHPFIGQSNAIVQIQMENMRQGEGIIDFVNGYLAIALFSGLIGLAIFVGAILLQAYNVYVSRRLARTRGGGGFVDHGLGVVIAAGSMFPFIPTDSRIVLMMILLFALSNAVKGIVSPNASADNPSILRQAQARELTDEHSPALDRG